MSQPEKIYIVGIGDDGLEGITAAARQRVEQAELLVGAEQALAAVPGAAAARMEVGHDLGAVVERIRSAVGQRVVVLTSGDPLFYGVARYLCEKLGKERFEVLPHVSSMQLAFARVKEPWDEAYLANLATQSLDRVVEKVRTATQVGLFTTESCQPAVIARALLDRRIDYFQAYVCENLGSPDERVTRGELAEVAQQQFAPLNVMILVRKPDVPDRPTDMAGRRLFGNPDEAFLQSKPKRGLLTPVEVRTLALAELDLGPTSTLWDVGAGSGSVAIEAAQIAAGGNVYAIEMDAEDFQLIRENADRFGVTNLVAVHGVAPTAWENLPDPDAVFVGGTGREVSRIVEQAYARLRPGGRLAVNVSSLDNLAALNELSQRLAGDVRLRMINISLGVSQLERVRFEALNPTFLLSMVKHGGPGWSASPQVEG